MTVVAYVGDVDIRTLNAHNDNNNDNNDDNDNDNDDDDDDSDSDSDNDNSSSNNSNKTVRRLSQEFPFLFVPPSKMDTGRQPMSAAQWRKQRRLRSWWRHEQQSTAPALATYQHHSAPQGQKKLGRGGG